MAIQLHLFDPTGLGCCESGEQDKETRAEPTRDYRDSNPSTIQQIDAAVTRLQETLAGLGIETFVSTTYVWGEFHSLTVENTGGKK